MIYKFKSDKLKFNFPKFIFVFTYVKNLLSKQSLNSGVGNENYKCEGGSGVDLIFL